RHGWMNFDGWRRTNRRRLQRRNPGSVLMVFAPDNVENRSLQVLGDRSWFSWADLAVVHFPSRSQLGRRAGHEDFFRDIEFIPGEALLHDGNSPFAGQLHHGVA